jgi:hypothetical protein
MRLTVSKPDGQMKSYEVENSTLSALFSHPFPGAISFSDVEGKVYIFRWDQLFMMVLENP